MDIIPYKQSLTHSCLVACFLMLLKAQANIEFTEAEEQDLALNGSKRRYSFYVIGIPSEIMKKYNKKIQVYADNKYFTKVLQNSCEVNQGIKITHNSITLNLVRELLKKKPLICHIDNNALGDYSHTSHFIVLEKTTKDTIQILDPWTGKKKHISNNVLEKAIYNLKTQVKMCPLLFSID